MSVRGDKGRRFNAVESSERPGTKGAIMDNKRCEITVALYGDTSDTASVPDVVALASPQYFVGAYALRDAHDEESGWHYPVVLRFEEADIVVDASHNEPVFLIKKCDTDACSMIKNILAAEKTSSSCPYLSHIELLDCCTGEQSITFQYSTDDNSVLLATENHAIRIF